MKANVTVLENIENKLKTFGNLLHERTMMAESSVPMYVENTKSKEKG